MPRNTYENMPRNTYENMPRNTYENMPQDVYSNMPTTVQSSSELGNLEDRAMQRYYAYFGQNIINLCGLLLFIFLLSVP